MDDTLHDASWRVFPAMNLEMRSYIARTLLVDAAEADRLRLCFWRRYGATLLGLMREHGVRAEHFLAETHRFPDLHRMLRADAAELAALRRLAGRKLVLTNAPRAYALRVLRQCGLLRYFESVISIEDMRQFGHLRPKPDARMLRHVLRRHGLRPANCVLVEDTLMHLRAARSIGMRGTWYTRYSLRAAQARPPARADMHGRPRYVHAKIRSLWNLRPPIRR